MKKYLKWLMPVVAILLIAMLATACGSKNTTEDPPTAVPENMKLYWNIDGALYREEGALPRVAGADGLYRAAFAADGVQVDLFFDNYATLEQVDKSDVVAMVVDENNLVKEVYDIYDVTGGVASYKYFVQEIYDDHLVTNSALHFRSQKQTLKIDENTVVYDVGSTGPLCGLPYELVHGSEILLAIQNKAGVVTHIFAAQPFEKKPVYWNIDRQYDSATKLTKREANEFGRYVFRMAVDGEIVVLECKDLKVASAVDSYSGRCVALEFDEEGYIIKARAPSNSTGNGSVASWYHITELKENGFVAEKFAKGKDQGTVKEVKLTADVKIFDVSTKDDNAGKPTTLQMYDQVHCLRDASGDVCIVFVVKRYGNAEIYWNLDRQYSSNTKSTKRIPDADGYYHFRMHYNGEYVDLRTNDKSIANIIDARAAKCCALTVENGIITYADHPKVAPVTLWASNYTITSIAEDGTLTAYYKTTDKYETAVMSENCKVYDMSKYAKLAGEETTLREGDKVYPLKGLDGKVQTIYVIDRYLDSPLYWNLDRSYDSTNKVTKRTPEADGYYYFRMLRDDRKVVTVRTNSNDMANKIDSWVACGLVLKGNEVESACKFSSVYLCEGGSFASYAHITKITDTRLTAKKIVKANDQGEIFNKVFSSHLRVYDISPSATKIGEPTTLRVGDQIQGFMNINKRITAVYVLKRSADVPMYWNVSPEAARTPAADGYYYLTMATGGKQVELKTKDASLVATIDGQSAKIVGLETEGDIITAAYLPKDTVSGFDGVFGNGYKITKISGNEITAVKGQKTVIGTLLKGGMIYDVSGMDTFVGAAAKPQVGDVIYGLIGEDGKITTLYITGRTVFSEIYWNLSPNAARTPEADGYYRIKLAVNGQVKTFRTTSAELIKKIENTETRCVGLKLNGDEILSVYDVAYIDGYTGGNTDVWCDIVTINGNSYTLLNNVTTSDNFGKKYTVEISAACPIYSGYTGAATTLKVDDRILCLKDSNDQVTYVVVVNRPTDTAKTAYCQACDKTATWYVWDGASGFLDGKHYYLAADTKQLATGNIEADTTVCLDLNGKTLTGEASILRNFNIKGHFSLMDSGNTGKVIATKENASMSPVFSVSAKSTFKLYGGTLTSLYSAERGGVGLIQEGTMYMYGGVLEGGKTTSTATNRGGGNLEVITNGTFYMYGGTIRNGNSISYGGNVSAYASAKIYLLGGVIENGHSDMGGNDVAAKGNITVGGTMKIGELYMFTGKLIKVSSDKPLTTGASIGVILEAAGVFTESISATTASYFHSCTDDEIYQEDNGTLSIGMHVLHKHCVCMGADKNHSCNDNQLWEPWPGNTAWESGKYYYLTADVKDTAAIRVEAGEELNLCLNGYDLVGKTSLARMLYVYGTLNICDHKDNGSFGGTIKSRLTDGSKNAPVFCVYDGGVLTVYGGNFTSENGMTEGGIGVTNPGGTMYIYDGYFYGGSASTTSNGGGNISVYRESRLVMYGGIITGGTSAKNGANVYLRESTSIFEMYGGTISGGTAINGAVAGKGQIVLGGNATVTGDTIYLLTGATIEVKDNFAGNATVEMKDGTGKFGTAAITVAGKILAQAGYAIVQDGKDLYLETA